MPILMGKSEAEFTAPGIFEVCGIQGPPLGIPIAILLLDPPIHIEAPVHRCDLPILDHPLHGAKVHHLASTCQLAHQPSGNQLLVPMCKGGRTVFEGHMHEDLDDVVDNDAVLKLQ